MLELRIRKPLLHKLLDGAVVGVFSQQGGVLTEGGITALADRAAGVSGFVALLHRRRLVMVIEAALEFVGRDLQNILPYRFVSRPCTGGAMIANRIDRHTISNDFFKRFEARYLSGEQRDASVQQLLAELHVILLRGHRRSGKQDAVALSL